MPKSDTQFKPGESGNPKGRPVGALGLKSLIEKVWNEEITDADGNKKIAGLIAVKAIYDKAAKGDVPAFKALAERAEGMPKQEIDMSGQLMTMPGITINGKELKVDIGDQSSRDTTDAGEVTPSAG